MKKPFIVKILAGGNYYEPPCFERVFCILAETEAEALQNNYVKDCPLWKEENPFTEVLELERKDQFTFGQPEIQVVASDSV